jgi:hypothetical protein
MAPSTEPAAIAASLIRQAAELERAIQAARAELPARRGLKGQLATLGRAGRCARRLVLALSSLATACELRRCSDDKSPDRA